MGVVIAALVLVLLFLLYGSSLDGPFVFDDRPNIVENSSVHLENLSARGLVSAARDGPVSNRPVAYLSFALNYRLHGSETTGYRVANLLMHWVTGILLYFLVKLTLSLPSQRANWSSPRMISLFTALIWLVHPLATQTVAYIVQRMNGMAAMFYILALLLFVRARLRGPSRARWTLFAASGVAGLLALGTKEIAATLPIFVLLYEWYFFQDLDPRWLKRYAFPFFAAVLILSLLFVGGDPLVWLESGYEKRHFDMLERLLTESRVVLHYLGLLAYPNPANLSLSHSFPLSHSLIDPPTTLLALAAIAALLWLAVRTARRERLLSFGILWFFGTLVIESTIIPLEIFFEHRTYLPSTFVLLVAVAMLYRFTPRQWMATALAGAVVLGFANWTSERARVWADELVLWRDVVEKAPDDVRAWTVLGVTLNSRGRSDEAISAFRHAQRLDPSYVSAYVNHGKLLLILGRAEEAVELLQEAVRHSPEYRTVDGVTRYKDYWVAKYNLGLAFYLLGRLDDAEASYLEVLLFMPEHAETLIGLSEVLLAKGDPIAANRYTQQAARIDPSKVLKRLTPAQLEQASVVLNDVLEEVVRINADKVRRNPNNSSALIRLGSALSRLGWYDVAFSHLSRATSLDPENADGHYALAHLNREQGRLDDAIRDLARAITLDPGRVVFHQDLGATYVLMDRSNEAIETLEHAIALGSKDAAALSNLGLALVKNGRIEEGILRYHEALEAGEDSAGIHFNLGSAEYLLGVAKREPEPFQRAVRAFSEALRIDPGHADAHASLGVALLGLGRAVDAEEHLAEALRINPEHEDATKYHPIAAEQARNRD